MINTMNFTPELSSFQGLLLSTDNIHTFANITSRGGNEETILDIVSKLYTFLVGKRCITKTGIVQEANSEVRKYALYLVLNSDLPVLEELIEMPSINMVIWTVPKINKCLLCEMIWGLNMEKFLYEIITYCNPKLGLQIAKPFIYSVRYSSPSESLIKAKNLSVACYNLICRLNFFDYSDSYYTALLTEIFESFLTSITYFANPPNMHKLNSRNEEEMYRFIGNKLLQLMDLVMECLQHFISIEKFDPDNCLELYKCTIKPEDIKCDKIDFKICDSPNEKLTEYLRKCNTALLDKCMELVMEVTVDIFCAWSEFEDDGKSFQQIVGEKCYLLHEMLKKVESVSEHTVLNMLLQISSKPQDIQDLVKTADVEAVIKNIEKNDESKAQWVVAILDRENWHQDPKLITCLLANIESLNDDNRLRALKTLLAQGEFAQPNTGDNIKILAVNLFKHCDHSRKLEVLSEHFKSNTFTNVLDNTLTCSIMTEIFNKLIATPDVDVSDVLTAFIQNPEKTYMAILTAAIDGSKQCEVMLKIMKLIKDYSKYYYETDTQPCLLKCIEKFSRNRMSSDKQEINLVKFILELKNDNTLPGTTLLMLVIMPNLHLALLDRDISIASVQIKLLKEAFVIDELLPFRAPVLAMLAQVLEVFRWSLVTFSARSPHFLENVIKLQQTLFGTYGGNIPERELLWMKDKIKDLSAINMYYFKEIWNPPGDNFIQVLSGQKRMRPAESIVFLAKVLVIATPNEWIELWHNNMQSYGSTTTLDILFVIMSAMFAAEKKIRATNTNTWQCLVYCYSNVVLIIKEQYFKEPLTNSQVEPVLEKIVLTMNSLNEAQLEDMIPQTMSLMSYIAEKGKDLTINPVTFTYRAKSSKFATLINQALSRNPENNGSS